MMMMMQRVGAAETGHRSRAMSLAALAAMNNRRKQFLSRVRFALLNMVSHRSDVPVGWW